LNASRVKLGTAMGMPETFNSQQEENWEQITGNWDQQSAQTENS
jgi:hypothetical protein